MFLGAKSLSKAELLMALMSHERITTFIFMFCLMEKLFAAKIQNFYCSMSN